MRSLTGTLRINRVGLHLIGFTLLEVMVALTLTLLMMLALARAFKLIGSSISKSQSELSLNADLREVTNRLRQELSQIQAGPNLPVNDQANGYLTYYEGPMTSMTTTHVRLAAPLPDEEPDYIENSRFGDLDDYLAFTTKTPTLNNTNSENSFMGYIPRGVLAAKAFVTGRSVSPAYSYFIDSAGDYTLARAVELVPFFSEEAEIAYWLSPQWETVNSGALTGSLQYFATGTPFESHPQYRDRNNDGLPDRMNLHRRVLLVRDDLNIEINDLRSANGMVPDGIPERGNEEVVPFLLPDTGAGQRVVPLSSDGFTEFGINAQFNQGVAHLAAPGVWEPLSMPADPATAVGTAVNAISPDWLAGLARLQQFMDLSVCRAVDDWSLPHQVVDDTGFNHTIVNVNANSRFGMPTALVRANTLSDLTEPHNRFAFVRVPGTLLGGPGVSSSMPQLALCPPHRFMVAAEDLTLSSGGPIAYDETTPLPDVPTQSLLTPGIVRDLPAQAVPGSGTPQYGHLTMTGFLRPEFNLQDRVAGPSASDRTNPFDTVVNLGRGGADIVATNVLSFDVRVLDTSASSYVSMGADGVPGTSANDDGDGLTDEADELAFPGSDDELVMLEDLNVRRVLQGANSIPQRDGRGQFVDLNYGHLPGHPLGNVMDLAANLDLLGLSTSFGGVAESPTGVNSFAAAAQQSGRFVIQRSGNTALNSFFQPMFDTYTTGYAMDDFDQEGAIHPHLITIVGVGPTPPPDQFLADRFGTPDSVAPNTTFYRVTRDLGDGSGSNTTNAISLSQRFWSNVGVLGESQATIDGDPFWTSPASLTNNGRLNVDTPNSTSALPLPATLNDRIHPVRPTGNTSAGNMRAIQIQIRLYDADADEIRQQTVIQAY